MAGDHAGALLFQQVAELEDRSEHVAQPVDHGLDAPDMVEDITEIRPGVGVDTRQVEPDEFAGDFAHRSQDALEPE